MQAKSQDILTNLPTPPCEQMSDALFAIKIMNTVPSRDKCAIYQNEVIVQTAIILAAAGIDVSDSGVTKVFPAHLDPQRSPTQSQNFPRT